MKTLIVCISIAHGNTQKIANAMAETLNADILRPQEVDAKIISKYDLIGFGSGIYYFKHHRALLELVDKLQNMNKKAFVFSTSGRGSEKHHKALREKLSEKGFDIVDEFSCKGFDTWGPYKLTGGRNKGKPDERDLENARIFAKNYQKAIIIRNDEIRKNVREGYGKIAKSGRCCGNQQNIGRSIGYSGKDVSSVPEGANSFGCGNPIALASIKEGETVLDLGSGTGFDCFLAAQKAGSSGKIIGVDMTPEMVEKAKKNAKKGNYKNVEFRLGEIEKLPVESNSVDLIISNCVINLSPDKKKVFSEAFRVLKPGGRIMVSDIVLTKELPPELRNSIAAHVGCLAGAMEKEKYVGIVKGAGFRKIKTDETMLPVDSMINDPFAKQIVRKIGLSVEEIKKIAESAVSIKISGVKA